MKMKTFRQGLSTDEITALESVYKVAKRCNYEAEHSSRVTNFALEIFDDLIELHQFGHQERFYLLCGSLLHDIGVHTDGPHAHHKKALKIILKTPILLLNQKERLIIGSIARYHRRALPSLKHDHYRALNPQERKIVSVLSGIMRVADGLDYTHRSRVKDVSVTFNKNKIKFLCVIGKQSAKKELQSAEEKSDLLGISLNRQVTFDVREEPSSSKS